MFHGYEMAHGKETWDFVFSLQCEENVFFNNLPTIKLGAKNFFCDKYQ